MDNSNTTGSQSAPIATPGVGLDIGTMNIVSAKQTADTGVSTASFS